jgi:DNA-binding transcriptional ArsR family regulator
MDGEAQCLDYVLDYVRKGAVRFAGKAPTDSRRLARAVRETLKEWGRRLHRQASGDSPAAFHGGELVIYPNRAELLGVRIMADRGDGHSLRILRALSRRRGLHYVRLALNELMADTAICSQGSVTGCIRKLRRNCSERLLRDLNVLCGLDDVIIRNEQGYQFAPSITVRIVDDRPADSHGTAETSSDTAHVTADAPAHVTGDIPDVPAVGTALSLNERQQWALSEIGRGVRLQRSMLEAAFDVSDRTAKRDLLELRQAGLIAWVREGSAGFYRLAESAEAAA